jgi:hypothetical protein
MSLSVLKRKSERFRNAPVSGGRSGGGSGSGFSLNGTLRNTTGFRLLSCTTRTPFKGALPCGHGTCCGEYAIRVSNSGSAIGINDATIIKRTNVSDATMRALKFRWIRGGTYPRVWHKDIPTAQVETGTQELHIKRLREKAAAFKPENALKDGCGRNTVPTLPLPGTPECECLRKVGGGASAIKHLRIRITTKPGKTTVSQGHYLTMGGFGRRECLPTPATKQPFPFVLSHSSGCDINYLRWEDAQADGLLPTGYVG